MMHRWGDSIAVYAARQSGQLTESFNWLRKWNIPFDVILVSTAWMAAVSKQHMLKYLRKSYRMVGTH